MPRTPSSSDPSNILPSNLRHLNVYRNLVWYSFHESWSQNLSREVLTVYTGTGDNRQVWVQIWGYWGIQGKGVELTFILQKN